MMGILDDFSHLASDSVELVLEPIGKWGKEAIPRLILPCQWSNISEKH